MTHATGTEPTAVVWEGRGWSDSVKTRLVSLVLWDVKTRLTGNSEKVFPFNFHRFSFDVRGLSHFSLCVCLGRESLENHTKQPLKCERDKNGRKQQLTDSFCD